MYRSSSDFKLRLYEWSIPLMWFYSAVTDLEEWKRVLTAQKTNISDFQSWLSELKWHDFGAINNAENRCVITGLQNISSYRMRFKLTLLNVQTCLIVPSATFGAHWWNSTKTVPHVENRTKKRRIELAEMDTPHSWFLPCTCVRVMQRTVLLSQFCPSVCLCQTRVSDKTKWYTEDILIPHFSFLTPTVVGGRRPLPSEIYAQNDPPSSKKRRLRFPRTTS